MSARPLVSICLPNLNQRQFLDARMSSILSQTFDDWELVVCDSHSDDGSWEFLQGFAQDPRVRLFQVPRAGIYAGWNDCLQRARGELISIAPADDTAKPEFLARMVGALEQHADVHLAVCQFDYIDVAGNVMSPAPRRNDLLFEDWVEVPHRRPREADILTQLCVGIPWMTATALVFRTSLLRKTGLFRTDCGSRADAFWALRASLCSDSIALPGRMATWRQHSQQGSASWSGRWWRQNWQRIRVLLTECQSQLPEVWRQDGDWMRELLAVQRTRGLRSLGVDRNALRKSAIRFAANCFRGLIQEPRYTARRLFNRLAWDDPELKDEYTHLNYLLEKWRVGWQPEEVDI